MNDLEDHRKKCRLCLKPLANIKYQINKDTRLRIQNLNIEIINSPLYSKYICVSCECKLQGFSKFRNEILEQQKTLSLHLCRIKDFRDEQPSNDPLKVEFETEMVTIKTEPVEDELLQEINICKPKIVSKVSHRRKGTKLIENDRKGTKIIENDRKGTKIIENDKVKKPRSCKNLMKTVPKKRTGPRFACDYCGLQRSSRKILSEHIFSTHKLKSFEVCEVCCERFSCSVYEHNIATHGPFICQCGEDFKYKEGLIHHHKYVHNPELYTTKCPECDSFFKNEAACRNHARQVHRPEINSICESCGMSFKYRATFLKHECPNGQKNRFCVVPGCKKVFSTREQLKEHNKTDHVERQKFTCTFPGCGKVFCRKQWVKDHIALIHENRPKNCPVEGCQYQSPILHYMRSHIKVHRDLSYAEMFYYKQVIIDMFPKTKD